MIRLNCDDWMDKMTDLGASVRDWYVDAFPTDDLGPKIPAKLTFWNAIAALNIGADFYCFLGDAADSIVRERIFGRIANIMDCDYDTVYNTWMGG